MARVGAGGHSDDPGYDIYDLTAASGARAAGVEVSAAGPPHARGHIAADAEIRGAWARYSARWATNRFGHDSRTCAGTTSTATCCSVPEGR